MSDTAEAKRQLPLPALLHRLGFGKHAKKSARCPFHDDKRNSFSVWKNGSGFWFWKCHAGCGEGDEITFLEKHGSLSNSQAIKRYLELAGVNGATPLPPSTASTSTAKSASLLDWRACVNAFTEKHLERLAKWRGYPMDFCRWLKESGLVGLYDRCIACPVHDHAGNVVAAHYRVEDGSWRYFPQGVTVRPLVIGELIAGDPVHVFESYFDAFVFMDLSGERTGIIITRGAGNGSLVAGLIPAGTTVHAWKQNDELKNGRRAGDKWLNDVAAHAGPKVVWAKTPEQFKDLNDWTRAGATVKDLLAAMVNAEVIRDAGSGKGSSPELPDPAQTQPFPLHCLPPAVEPMARAIAETERAPESLAGCCTLGILSASIGAGIHVQSSPQRVTRGNLEIVASAESGSGKSETFRHAARPFFDFEREHVETWQKQNLPDLEAEHAILKSEIAVIEKKAGKADGRTERDEIRADLAAKKAALAEAAAALHAPALCCEDVTSEKLAVLLMLNREQLASLSPDAGAIVNNLLGRYSKLDRTDETIYLKAYSGDYCRVDRQKTPEPVILRSPCLAALWLTQADKVETLLAERGLTEGGLIPRLLICHTHAKPRPIIEAEAGIPARVSTTYADLIRTLLETYRLASEPRGIRCAPEAMSAMNAHYNAIVKRRCGDLRDVTTFAARWTEQAWRIAVCLHAGLHGARAHEHKLELDTAKRAIELADWFAAQQLEILSASREKARREIWDEVLSLLARHPKGIRASDVYRARIVRNADEAHALLAAMEAAGELLGRDEQPEGGGHVTRVFTQPKK